MSISRYTKLRVLVVDDVRAMRLILRSLLRSCGVEQVLEAGDGLAALEILRVSPVDLVVSDLLMSPMNGLELVRQLRRPDATLHPAVPVLMVSGNTDVPSVTAAIESGVNEFLGKPLTPAAFRQRLESMLNNPRPLVKTENYWGPERRRRQMWVRHDRRVLTDHFLT